MPSYAVDERAFLPIVRRLMATGTGPAKLASWAVRHGMPRGIHSPDDMLAQRLASRLVATVRSRWPGSYPSAWQTRPVPMDER